AVADAVIWTVGAKTRTGGRRALLDRWYELGRSTMRWVAGVRGERGLRTIKRF
ncbi:unnamed protein product, partial [Citrullus colocynthis]